MQKKHSLTPLIQVAVALTALTGIASYPATTIEASTLISAPENGHQESVKLARQGYYESALDKLAPLVAAYPEKSLFRYDYITILSWAGRDKEVISQTASIDFTKVPSYVLKAIGKSARNSQKPQIAIDAYRSALKQEPTDRQARIGLATSLAEVGNSFDANAHMAILLKNSPESIELLETLAYIKEADNNYAAAIDIYDKILQTDPSHSGSKRKKVMALLKLGAPHEARRIALANPEIFTQEEWQLINGDMAAREIQWGRLPTIDNKERYRDTDSAIKLLQNQYAQMDTNSDAALRNRFDLIVAYNDRNFMHKAVALYETLKNRNVDYFPPYVSSALANAYLTLRSPRKAVTLLEQSIREYPYDINAQHLLFYAYLESGQYEKSLNHIDSLLDSLPKWSRSPDKKQRQANPDWLYTKIIAAMARAYTGRLDKAESRLKTQLSQTPANTDIRNSLASVYLWRGWPHLATREFNIVKTMDPENRGARIGMVSALAAIGDYASADIALESLVSEYGDDVHVQNLVRDTTVRNMREIWIETINSANSGNIYQGSNDLSFAAFYYDKPWKPGLRPYIHLLHRKANFKEQEVRRKRLAAGIDYHGLDMKLRASVGDGDGSTNLSLNGYWMTTDRWRNSLSFDSFSPQTPLRADLTAVEAWSAEAGTEYRFHESRNLGMNLQYMEFDDKNQRTSLSLFANERLISWPRYRLDAGIYLYHQTNSASRADYNYFNPLQLDSFSLTLNNEWTVYKHYEKSMQQKLALSIGSNRQKRFPNNKTWSISYEHYWSFSKQFSIGYGIKRAQLAYDGVIEFSNRGFFNLYARF